MFSLIRLIAGSGSPSSRIRRLHAALAACALVTMGVWTWVFLHFDLGFGGGIDLFLLLVFVDQLNRARKAGNEDES
jgi:hypothetical protein